MSKVSIIGGSGFIGTNLCQLLFDADISFEIIDIKKSQRFENQWVQGDVRDVQSLRGSIGGDIIVNLAAVHRDDIRDMSEYTQTNTTGASNVVQVCREKGIKKIVFTSSVAVYGFTDPDTGEDGDIAPFNEYGRTKYEAELVLREWRGADKENQLIIVRPTVVFGEGNRGNVYNLLNQVASGRFVMVGDGENRKSMAYVGNVVSFLKTCIESDCPDGLFNYVDKPDMDMNSLVLKVRRVLANKSSIGPRLPYKVGMFFGHIADGVSRMLKKSLPISAVRVQKFCATTTFSTAKETLSGFEAPFSLEDGVERTLKSEFIEPDPHQEIFYTE